MNELRHEATAFNHLVSPEEVDTGLGRQMRHDELLDGARIKLVDKAIKSTNVSMFTLRM